MSAPIALLTKIEQIRPTLHGWCGAEKSAKLAAYICDTRPEITVEIGVFGGSSLIPQVLALKQNGQGKAYGIDPWKVDAALEEMKADENVKWWTKVDLDLIRMECVRAIQQHKLEEWCELIQDKAENVVDRFTDESVGLLHIDGNHSEALSFKDATLYLPKVKPGGLVFLDDIWWTDGQEEPTTRRACLFLSEHCERIELVGDCMILRKR